MSSAAARAALFGGTGANNNSSNNTNNNNNTAPKPLSSASSAKKTLEDVLKEGDWVEKQDEKSGKNYYYNKKTKQTTWDLVKELGLAASSAANNNSAAPSNKANTQKTVADVLKEGEWVEKKDDKTGKSYYYNKASKKTTWDLAKELGLSSTASNASQQKTVADVLKEGEWVEKKDDKTGKSYYYNKNTKKTTWDLAKELGLNSNAAIVVPKKKTLDDVLKEGDWAEKKDEKTGKPYYFNKKTRTTTWDLIKELGLSDGKEEAAAAAEVERKQREAEEEAAALLKAEEEENSQKNNQQNKTLAQVLAEGEWIEKIDQKSGRKFYVNKNTKATTWNLAKDLGLAGGDANETHDDEGNKKPFKAPTSAELLQKGIWKQVKDYRGLPYYIKSSTGESCADLDLYLRIKLELEGPSYFSKDILDLTGNPMPLETLGVNDYKNRPSGEARRQAGQGITQMKDWIDFFTQTHDSEKSEKRLLTNVTKREIEDARESVTDAKKNEDILRKQLAIREQEITNLRSLLSIQNREVQQLQCALFYGMGSGAYNANVTQSAFPNNNNNQNSYSSSSKQQNNSSNLLLPPPPLDAMIARDEHHPENIARRMATLERLVFELQGHNRGLVEQLTLALEGKHRHSECSVCQEHDPWARLMSVAHSPSRMLRE